MSFRKFLRKFGLFLLTLPLLGFIYFPILWLLSSSFSTQGELVAIPPHWIPQHPTLQNYLDIFFPDLAKSAVPKAFSITLINSFQIATTLTVICLIIGILAAYVLARVKFKGRHTILLGILGTKMIPEISLIIPLFVVASQLKLIDKPAVLVITYMSFALPFAIWMLATFFQSVPIELEEAARLDGCSRMGIIFRIVLPIASPGLVSTALFIFLLSWDEFFYALIFTSTLASKTVPVAISEFVGRYVTNITGMMAGGILAALPPVLLALIFQRYIVRGLTAGAVKG